jgi:hypothetical protein
VPRALYVLHGCCSLMMTVMSAQLCVWMVHNQADTETPTATNLSIIASQTCRLQYMPP